MKKIYMYAVVAAVLSLVLTAVFYFSGNMAATGPGLIAFFALLALGVRGREATKGFTFTLGIFAAVTLSMYYPSYFISWGSFELKVLIVPLLQIIMFGMGTAMSVNDFAGVIKMPKGVLIGLLCQFSFMPFVGYLIASSFGFSPEIAAGIILVGSSPSGLASNVMAYISKANLALSITLTAVATMLAPLVTPSMMKWLAGELIPIDFWAMMWSITKIVIIPVVAGLLVNWLFRKYAEILNKVMPLVSMLGIGFIITIITAAGRDSLLNIGLLLIVACLIHNLTGYVLGYWTCRLSGMDERSCRTIALEVGLQNAGLASGIASELNRIATLGLAAAVFGPMMNITGSSLATWWRGRPLDDEIAEEEASIPA